MSPFHDFKSLHKQLVTAEISTKCDCDMLFAKSVNLSEYVMSY